VTGDPGTIELCKSWLHTVLSQGSGIKAPISGGLPPILIIFSGLPGTGKTTIAKELACQIGAVDLCIDSIEHANLASGAVRLPPKTRAIASATRLPRITSASVGTVIVDSVNPLQLTRDAWAKRGGQSAGQSHRSRG
jgi:AAA+ superfamily predicted ATPase